MKLNKIIINQLDKLKNILKIKFSKSTMDEEKVGLNIRIKNINHAINIIKNMNQPIKSIYDLLNYNINKVTLDKIRYIIENPNETLPIITYINIDDYLNFMKNKSQLITKLSSIMNINEKLAISLIKKYKISSINDLIKKAKANKIKYYDKIISGIKAYKKFKINIPYDEITQISNIIQYYAYTVNKNFIIKVAGSYRRLLKFSNDINIIITTNKKHLDKKDNNFNLFKHLIVILKKKNILKEDIIYKKNKYTGLIQLNKISPMRKIDLMYVDYEEYPTSLMFYTGSYLFNEFIYKLAYTKNIIYKKEGLFDKYTKNRIKVENEKDIFEKLNISYITPEDRNYDKFTKFAFYSEMIFPDYLVINA